MSSEPVVREILSEEDVRRSHAVMKQLRPAIVEEAYVAQVLRQREGGYRLAGVEQGGRFHAVAGFRISEMLFQGRHLYVDDLITDEERRSRGHGRLLFDWLVAVARSEGCARLELDSGVQRFRAHAFYFRERMHISSYHFTRLLTGE